MSPVQPAAIPAASAPATPANASAPAPLGVTPTAPSGGVTKEGVVTVPLSQWRQTERDAARFRSRRATSAQERHDQRYSAPPAAGAGEEDDPQVLELRTQNQTLSSENMRLKVANQVRDLLAKDEYKNVPESVRRLVLRNPMALIDKRAKTPEDAVEDIQDYLDEEMELASGGAAAPGQPAAKPGEAIHQTPPVSSSGPTTPNATGEESIEGKTGQARSTAVLRNLFKKR